jgi:hypothetical protein
VAKQEHVGDGARAEVDQASVLSVLTTEHFTLQSARASTIGESSARAYLYVGAVSSALIALGFIGQASEFGAEFDAFALVVLPTVYILGLFTFVRLVQTSMEDLFYGRAINRIRSYYLQLLGDDSGFLLLGGHDDVYGVLANMGITKPSRWQLYLTLATMIAVLNSVVGGTTIALAASQIAAPPVVAVLVGAAALAVSLAAHRAMQTRAHVSTRESTTALFPSPARQKPAAGTQKSGQDLAKTANDANA